MKYLIGFILLILGIASFSSDGDDIINPIEETTLSKIETLYFHF